MRRLNSSSGGFFLFLFSISFDLSFDSLYLSFEIPPLIIYKLYLMRKMLLLLCLAAMSVSCADTFSSADGEKPRVMVLTDAEIDDQLSMVRFLLSSNEYEVEGSC